MGKKLEMRYNAGQREDGIMLIKIRKLRQPGEWMKTIDGIKIEKSTLADNWMQQIQWSSGKSHNSLCTLHQGC